MAKDLELKLRLSVKDDGSVVIKKFGGNVGGLKDKTKDTTESMTAGFKKVRTSLLAMVAAVASVTAAFALATREAAAQELAEAKLTQVITRVNGEGAAQVKMLIDLAGALQKTTKFGDDQIINAQALLGTFKLSADAVAQLTPRMLDMAAALEGVGGESLDLKGVTIALGKAFSDGIGMLKRYGLVMTEADEIAFGMANTQEKVAIVTRLLDSNFKGLAVAAGDTFTGEVAKLKNAWGDLLEELGNAIVKNTDMRAVLEAVKAKLEEWTQALKRNGPALKEFISDVTDLLVAVVKTAAEITGFIAENYKLIAAFTGLAIISRITPLIVTFGGVAAAAAASVRALWVAIGGPIGVGLVAIYAAVDGLITRWREAKRAADDYQRASKFESTDITALDDAGLKKYGEELRAVAAATKEAATEQKGFIRWLLEGDGAQEQNITTMLKTQNLLAALSVEEKKRAAAVAASAAAAKKGAEAAKLESAALDDLQKKLDATGKRYQQLASDVAQSAQAQIKITELLSQRRQIAIEKDVAAQVARLEVLGRLSGEESALQTLRELAETSGAQRIADEKKRLAQEVLAIERSSMNQQLALIAEQERAQVALTTKTIANAQQRAQVINQIETTAVSQRIALYTQAQATIEQRLAQALEAERNYTNQLKTLTQQITDAKASGEETLFRLKLSKLSETEKIAALEARALSLSGEAAKQAWVEFAQAGGDVEKAMKGVDLAIKEIEKGLVSQSEEVKKNLAAQSEATAKLEAEYKRVSGILKDLIEQRNELTKPVETKLTIDVDASRPLAAIEELKRPTSSEHTIYVRKVETNQTGGPVGLRSGGKLSGYGGGDKVAALLEQGEFVIRKEAVRRYGQGLFALLNSMQLPRDFALPKFSHGGPVEEFLAFSYTPPSGGNKDKSDCSNLLKTVGTLRFIVGTTQANVYSDYKTAETLRRAFSDVTKSGYGIRMM